MTVVQPGISPVNNVLYRRLQNDTTWTVYFTVMFVLLLHALVHNDLNSVK